MARALRSVAPTSILLVAGSLLCGSALGQTLPSDAFLSYSAAERSKPALLAAPLKALRVATLEWPYPLPEGVQETSADDAAYAYPPPLVLAAAPAAFDESAEDSAPTVFGPLPVPEVAYAEVALDMVLSLPGLDGVATVGTDASPDTAAEYGPDLSGLDAAPGTQDAADSMWGAADPAVAPELQAALINPWPEAEARATAVLAAHAMPLYRDRSVVFGPAGSLFPALAFEHWMPDDFDDEVPTPIAPPGRDDPPAGPDAAPAVRLGLEGARRAQAEKCLAEAIYFESRGEPKRGQIAVAQVVINRVFSGYYPADVCKAVYQNAHRRNACQFTFACDYVKDVIREPAMWVQAKEIAADMLDGKLWLDSVGNATHYHAYWVRPTWVREMRKLDRIGVHTFYRPRRWNG